MLQGLTTANIDELVDGGAPLYTGFLSAPGRVLFDALLYPADGGGVLVDVDASVLPALTQHLKRYKLRSKVALRDASDQIGAMRATRAVAATEGSVLGAVAYSYAMVFWEGLAVVQSEVLRNVGVVEVAYENRVFTAKPKTVWPGFAPGRATPLPSEAAPVAPETIDLSDRDDAS